MIMIYFTILTDKVYWISETETFYHRIKWYPMSIHKSVKRWKFEYINKKGARTKEEKNFVKWRPSQAEAWVTITEFSLNKSDRTFQYIGDGEGRKDIYKLLWKLISSCELIELRWKLSSMRKQESKYSWPESVFNLIQTMDLMIGFFWKLSQSHTDWLTIWALSAFSDEFCRC